MSKQMSKQTYVYIAGPYGDHEQFEKIDQNIETARQVAVQLAKEYIPFFCPHLNSAHFEVYANEVPVTFWRNMDNTFVDLASAVLLLPKWQSSKGAVEEKARAEQLGIPVFTDIPTLKSWWWSP